MIKLAKALNAWGTPEFEAVLKDEIQSMNAGQLPLQDGLSQTSYVVEEPINVMILNVSESAGIIHAKTGVFYAGIIAGSCCADDPTPVCEQTEYCEMQFDIDKKSAVSTVTILKDQ